MSSTEEQQGGIPTRAIHEAYLDMQRALKRYRTAHDEGAQAAVDDAHGDLQESILTLYELLRPHIKHNDAVQGYWEGEPPSYPHEEGLAPDPEDGKGVLEVQDRTENFQLDSEQVEQIDDVNSLEEWHEMLDLNGSVRLTGVYADGQRGIASFQAYQLGLRTLDDWKTEFKTVQTTLGGFMGQTGQTEQRRERVKIHKLKRAARELSDVLKETGFLPESDVPDNEDPLPI